jgi:replicative DNA helicase
MSNTQQPRASAYPYNLEAERALLACILQNSFVLDEVAPMLAPDDFYAESAQHASIYATMLDLYQARDLITCVGVERGMPHGTDATFSYLMHLMEHVVFPSDAAGYAKIIAADSKRRKVMHAGEQTVADAYADPDAGAVLERAEARFQAIGTEQQDEHAQTLAEISLDYLSYFSDLEKERGKVAGIPTGFHLLDFALGGLRPQQMITLAGRPGMGKTSLALSMVNHIALKQSYKVAFFSLEMSKEQLFESLLSMRTQVDGRKLRTPWVLTPEEKARVHREMSHMEMENLIIDDTAALSTTALRAKARRIKAQHGLDLIIVDYLQLMQAFDGKGKRYDNGYKEVSEISRAIKDIAKELHVPILALAQLSRAVENRQVKVPQMSDLRESGQIEQDSDVVLFIYRDVVYNAQSTEPHRADIIIAKQRKGDTGEVQLHFAKEYTQFCNVDSRESEG